MIKKNDSNMIYIISILLTVIKLSNCSNSQSSGFYFPATSVYAKSADLNTLYAISTSGQTVYRMNYTRDFSTITYNYTTAHTKVGTAIAVSTSEHYFATGSADYTIEVVEAFTKTRICRFSGYN